MLLKEANFPAASARSRGAGGLDKGRSAPALIAGTDAAPRAGSDAVSEQKDLNRGAGGEDPDDRTGGRLHLRYRLANLCPGDPLDLLPQGFGGVGEQLP